MELDSSELLEEALARAENTIFGTLRKVTERFIDIVNHDRVQQRIKQKLDEIHNSIEPVQQDIDRCKDATSVFEIFYTIKQLLINVQKIIGPSAFFSKTARNGVARIAGG